MVSVNGDNVNLNVGGMSRKVRTFVPLNAIIRRNSLNRKHLFSVFHTTANDDSSSHVGTRAVLILEVKHKSARVCTYDYRSRIMHIEKMLHGQCYCCELGSVRSSHNGKPSCSIEVQRGNGSRSSF